jgi:iron complex transport system substrate-binding protein
MTKITRRTLSLALLAAPLGRSSVSAQTPAASPAATPQLPVTVPDASGADVEITDISRIVSLNGNVTENLFALGLGANVVAVDVSALYPDEAAALPKIGYQRQLSSEAILSFTPTLVIGTEIVGPPEAIDQVRNAGVTVLILPVQKTTDGAVDEIRAIGAAVGLPEPANEIADAVAQTLTEAQALLAQAKDQPRVAFLYLRGDGTQLIAGTDSQSNAVIAAAGGVNVGAEIGIEAFQPITPEALVAAAPDVILVMRLGLQSIGGIDALLAIPGVAQTPAAQNERIVIFEDLYLLGFGPRIGDAVYDLTLALHPDLTGTPKHPEWQGAENS